MEAKLLKLRKIVAFKKFLNRLNITEYAIDHNKATIAFINNEIMEEVENLNEDNELNLNKLIILRNEKMNLINNNKTLEAFNIDDFIELYQKNVYGNDISFLIKSFVFNCAFL